MLACSEDDLDAEGVLADARVSDVGDVTADTGTPSAGEDTGSEPEPDIENELDLAEEPPDVPTVAEDVPADVERDIGADAPDPDIGVDPTDIAVAEDTGAVQEDVGPQTIAEKCFPGIAPSATEKGPEYDQFAPVIASHCFGTNHQAITGVEKVVFLGDSVMVGTPNDEHLLPTENDHYFRNQLGEYLATKFNLNKGDLFSWGAFKGYALDFGGKGGSLESGDFKNCAKWGARTDDLIAGGGQLLECFPTGGSDKRTLIVFTMGGNDIAAITKEGGDATPEEIAAGYPAVKESAKEIIQYLDDAMAWIKDPTRFPNGVFVLFANPYEFTDGTGITSACKPSQIIIPFIGPLDLSKIDINMAEVAGFKEWADKEVQKDIVIEILEQYMRVAVQYQVDMMMSLEHFCGHGFVATGPNADATNRCYKGPDAKLWFDISCFHPSEAGHTALADMFKAMVEE